MVLRVKDRPEDAKIAVSIFKAVIAGKTIMAAGAQYGCAPELARKRFNWAKSRLRHPRFLASVGGVGWPAGEQITQSSGGVPAEILEYRRCADFWKAIADKMLTELAAGYVPDR
jgi:hypothetical protein